MHDLLKLPNPGTKVLRDVYLYPLCNLGLLDHSRSVLNKSLDWWFPIDENAKAFSIFDGNDKEQKKLTVSKEYYPDKEFIRKEIEKFYRAFVTDARNPECSSDKKIYMILDIDGREISPDELVEKYFSNAETCVNTAEEAKNE